MTLVWDLGDRSEENQSTRKVTYLNIVYLANLVFSLRKFWRMLKSAVSLCTPENSANQKLSDTLIMNTVNLADYFFHLT